MCVDGIEIVRLILLGAVERTNLSAGESSFGYSQRLIGPRKKRRVIAVGNLRGRVECPKWVGGYDPKIQIRFKGFDQFP